VRPTQTSNDPALDFFSSRWRRLYPSVDDYIDFSRISAFHCHVCDDWTWDGIEVFTKDATFDGGDIGMGQLGGLDNIQARFAS
jgi:hypothetical protein